MKVLEKIALATGNPGKAREYRTLLQGLPFVLWDNEVEETGRSFRANAFLKAQAACLATGLPALGDDSGLSIPLLGGKPGIYSARFARGNYASAMERLYRDVAPRAKKPEDMRATFLCSLCLVFPGLAWPDGRVIHVQGRVRGHLVWPPRGAHGFGYDPFFVAKGETRTFSEMPPEEKLQKSHRARAVRLLREKFS